MGRASQYLLFWYIAETLPPDLESSLSAKTQEQAKAYQVPTKYPENLALRDRLAMEPEDYEPVRHENTGVNDEEALYEAHLLPIEEATKKLGRSVMADVVTKGWTGIRLRIEMEGKEASRNSSLHF